jgi:hypothetical protein
VSLPIKVIDRLFERLSATYGAAWVRQWQDVPISDVKTAWAHELAGYEKHLEAIAWALENLPEDCPNAIKFRNLCRLAPAKAEPVLPAPKADPARVAAELAKLQPIRDRSNTPRVDGRDWARRIVGRHAAGEKILPLTLRMAQEALESKHEKLLGQGNG